MKKQKTLFLCEAGIVAALYTALTLLSGMLGLASGAIQFRISEALCILPVFFPAAIPGLTLGCLISDVLTQCLWQDVLFGTLATLIGAVGARLLGKLSVWLTPIPTVLANTLILPWVFVYAYRAEAGVFFLFCTVGAGEILSAYVCGMLLLLALRRYGGALFRGGFDRF